MKIDRFVLFVGLIAGVAGYSLCNPGPSWGQKPPPPANPQAPTINPLQPTGVQRGQSLELTVTGTLLTNPTGITFGVPAKVVIPTEGKNGQDATKFKVRIDVPADTPIGWYPFRIATPKGVSNLRVFCVDDVPQILGAGTNRSRETAQAVAVPSAVSGAVAAELADFYKITVKAGQRLSFDCQARRIGSAIDAQMSIYDAKTMREIAYANDSPGCHTDPRISFTFKEGGDYLVQIKDVLNRGGAEFFYRIRIGDFPMATTAIPMGIRRGSKAKIDFAGPAVDGVAAVDVTAPSDPSADLVWVSPKGAAGLSGWPVPVTVSNENEAAEQEPNNNAKEANRITAPGAVTGRFQKSDDVDFYLFSAKKGQKFTIVSQALDAYSPTLVYLYVRNGKTGAEIAKSNPLTPTPNDQKVDFTAPDDGDYLLEVQHLHFAGGPSESYRIVFRAPAATFELNLVSERFGLSPGGAAAVPVQVVRKGYTGPIELSVQGNPALSGAVTLKAGQNAGVLLVVGKGDLPMGAYSFQVVGKAAVDKQDVVVVAEAGAMVVQSMNGLKYPPGHLLTSLSLAVSEKAPFSLAIKMDPPDGIPGSKVKVTVTAKREAGFDDEITLSPPTGLPPTVPAPKTIPAIGKGKVETSFPLDLTVKTALGEYFVLVGAKTKFKGKEYAAMAPPLMLAVGAPFDLKVEPATVALKPGEKIKLKVTATRKGGYAGPISVDVRNLPANVTSGKAVIAAGKDSIDLDVGADAKAAPATAANVTVGGVATALNNLAGASLPFTVTVQKK